MKHQTHTWGRSRFQLRQPDVWIERLAILGLLGAALALFLWNLGALPLRDWDEGTVAQVAREIQLASPDSQRWLFPTLWGEPYLNKPPLVHQLVALAFSVGGTNEWMARLPGAVLTALSVPLLYGVGREIFPSRRAAFLGAAVYLTTLPVVRHGRLAMLDGTVTSLGILTLWCALRSRRDGRWSLGIGIGFGLICLTKGIVGLLFAAIAIGFLLWDTPRLLGSLYLWGGFALGSLPVLAWYYLQWLTYQQEFVETAVVGQSLARIWTAVDRNGGPPWFYASELLKSMPWLLFALYGLRSAWQHRNWSWSKLVLVWSGIYLAAVTVMTTKLPWYVVPVYPALSLAAGAVLCEAIDWPRRRNFPRPWVWVLGICCVAAIAGSVYGAIAVGDAFLVLALAAIAVSTGVGAILVAQRDVQFISILLWGHYVALLLFVSSNQWIWELNEAFPVKPVAEQIQQHVPPDREVYISFEYERPSLNFYSGRRAIAAPLPELQEYWERSPDAYLLLDPESSLALNLESARTYAISSQWTLFVKERNVDANSNP